MAQSGWVVGIGVVGLALFVLGSLLGAAPRVDVDDDAVVEVLVHRRTAMLTGPVLAITGVTLLLWPLAALASSATGESVSLGWFSLAAWVLGFGCFVTAGVVVAGLVWRDPRSLDPSVVRLVLDGAHLATWSVSAPIGAIATVASTAVGIQAGVLPSWVAIVAAAKVVTVVIEVAGTGRRQGWNAGGWALGVSGYVTVAWFLAVLWSLR